MNALFIYGDSPGKEQNTSHFRVLIPAKFLERAGHTIKIGNMPGYSNIQEDGQVLEIDGLDYTDVPEVVLFERNILPERIEKLRLAGAKRIIVTFDDHYGQMPDYNVSKPWWKRNYSRWLKALGMVDLVIVPSMTLVEAFRSYCKEIKYIPNFLDDDAWDGLVSTRTSKVIGWGGTDAHVESWRQKRLIKDLETFFCKHPDWSLRLYGFSPTASLPPSLLKDHRQWLPFSEWPKRVAEFQIGLAPLNGPYDMYRSNLKVLEYSKAGVPWIASAAAPYTKVAVRGGTTAYIQDWLPLLESLVGDEALQSKLAQEGREWGDSMSMSKHVADYERILWPSS